MRIIAIDPPFGTNHGVMFGMQAKDGVDCPVPATHTAHFDIEIEVRTSGTNRDFAGERVHGRRGDRFLYLVWGRPDSSQPFAMFARSKIKLADIPLDLLDRALAQDAPLEGALRATDTRGQPATGTIKSDAIAWRIGSV